MIESKESAIFKQERIGKDGKKFTMYKFRSMHGTTDDDEYRQILQTLVKENKTHLDYKLSFQPRVTKIGGFLRKTNLDELPQLLNVIKGEMHLIGPRPDIPYSVEAYEDWMKKRFLVPQGMTGLWQVSGGNYLSFHDMVRLDIEYVERQSPLLDLKILLKTVGLVLGRGGDYWSGNGNNGDEIRDKVTISSDSL